MRLLSLDVLRTIAVFLVLAVHAEWMPIHGGWIGVDLFFVLSGFLVGGLLFRELKTTGGLRPARFLVRRAWKIYPAFYALMAFTVLFTWLEGNRLLTTANVVSELLFLTNYAGKLWGHTWSLAVEEHFYLLLPFLAPAKRFPLMVFAVACVCLAARLVTPWPDAYFYTHTRIDALFFGALLAWAYYNRPEFKVLALKYRPVLAIAGMALISTAFVWDHNEVRWMQTVGVTLQYLGAGALVAAAVAKEWQPNKITQALAWVGTHSYSIYLWHLAVRFWFVPALGEWPKEVQTVLYYGLSIAFGISMAKLVEAPFLKLRDYFDAKPVSVNDRPVAVLVSRG